MVVVGGGVGAGGLAGCSGSLGQSTSRIPVTPAARATEIPIPASPPPKYVDTAKNGTKKTKNATVPLAANLIRESSLMNDDSPSTVLCGLRVFIYVCPRNTG